MAMPTLSDLKEVTSSLSVLYVEDEPMLRQGFASSLKQLFKHVEIAEDGLKGLALYKSMPFDMVITDISMPNMDGCTMIENIKRINPSARIIVTSAQNDSDKLMDLINLGVERFLLKPINKAFLIDSLFSLCSTIMAIKKAEMYQQELEQKVRLLNTQLKKDYVKTKQAEKSETSNSTSPSLYEGYHQDILQEEIDELCELNEELDADILLAFQNGKIDSEYVNRIAKKYHRYGIVLGMHSPFQEIGIEIGKMSQEFNTHREIFMEQITVIRELLESFNFTLITFRKNVFEKDSPNPTFYNASLNSDITMIIHLFQQTEITTEIEFF